MNSELKKDIRYTTLYGVLTVLLSVQTFLEEGIFWAWVSGVFAFLSFVGFLLGVFYFIPLDKKLES